MAEIIVNKTAIPHIELVIFDKDGTLIDVHQYWAVMVENRARRICRRLGLPEEYRSGLMSSMGVNVEEMRLKPEGPVGIKKREVVMMAAVEYLASQGFPGRIDQCREAFAEVDELSLGLLQQIIKPIAGLYSIFDALKNASCKIAIATTDLSERAWLAMAHLGLRDSIDFIAGADMVAQSKPHPEMLELVLRKLHVPPEQAVMVGDARTDVEMGINARVRAAIGVTSGLTSLEDLMTLTPHVIPDISALIVRLEAATA